jgi:DNA-binding transcriptional LysR family regulator
VPIIPDYLAQNPGVSVDLMMSDRLVDLVEEQFDIAISSSPLTRANLIGRELAPIRWTVCAAPAYMERSGAPTNPNDLRGHNCIYYTSAAVRGDVWTFARRGELITVRVSGNFRANNSEAVRDAALGGLGVALLPTFAAWDEVASGRLVPLLPEWQPQGTFGSTLIAYFIADRHLAPKIRTLVDFLVKRFGRTPYWDQGFSVGAPFNPPAAHIIASRLGERKKKHELGTHERLS